MDDKENVYEALTDDICDEDHLRACYTNVLKGHIALASLRFPQGTLGTTLDVLARTPLWSMGLDYGHGTGHGVGSYLNVHEGPQGISFRKRNNEAVRALMLVDHINVSCAFMSSLNVGVCTWYGHID